MIAEIKVLEDHAHDWLSRTKFKPTGALAGTVNKIADWCINAKAQIARDRMNTMEFWK
jgi:hypothetical protein